LRTCRECGFPLKFARYFDWRSDGTIIGTHRVKGQSRITFLECGELEGLFQDLSVMLGVSIDHILIEAEKNIGKAFYESTPLRFLRFAPHSPRMRPEWVAKASVRIVRNEVAGLGSGVIRAEYYRAGESMVIRIANPCFIERTVGNTVGIYESIERVRGVEYDYAIEDSELVIRMKNPSGPTETLADTRLALDPIMPAEGSVRFDRCAVCGVPLAASGWFQWDFGRGSITNRVTGKREVTGAAQTVSAMLRELEAELGEEVLGLLYDCQKEITHQRLARDYADAGGDFWERFLFEGAVRGLGHPADFRLEDGAVTVRIINAYQHTLYAAKIAAAFEFSTGAQSSIEWETRRPYMAAFTVSSGG
jgi:hypothetical protein